MIEYGSQPIDICGHLGHPVERLFWSRIAGGAHGFFRLSQGGDLGSCRLFQLPGQSKISHLWLVIHAHQDIGGLQIPVQHPVVVGVLDGFCDQSDTSCRRRRLKGALLHTLRQVLTRHVIHGKPAYPLIFSHIMHRHHPGVLEAAGRLSFPAESTPCR